MNREEIIQEVIKLLLQHKNGSSGSIHQEPYKGDFFKLFAAAFNAGLIESPSQTGCLSADALEDTLRERNPEFVTDKTLKKLHTFWQEWTYAWKHHSELQK